MPYLHFTAKELFQMNTFIKDVKFVSGRQYDYNRMEYIKTSKRYASRIFMLFSEGLSQ